MLGNQLAEGLLKGEIKPLPFKSSKLLTKPVQTGAFLVFVKTAQGISAKNHSMHLYQVQTPNSGRAGAKLWLWTSAFFSNSLPNPPTLFFPHRKASVLLQPTSTTSSSFPKSGNISQATNHLFQQHWYCCQRTSDHLAEILKGLCQAGSPTTSNKCTNCSSENIH